MLGALKRRWKTTRRPTLDFQNDGKEEPHDMAPPRFIEIQQGKISLGPVRQYDTIRDREILEARIAELEDALARLHERVNQSQCGSPTLEKDLREQLESMNRAIKAKERRAMQACRDHKLLQARYLRQESCLQYLTNENKTLQQRIRQYEHCLDDVMRKVVDAIVAEDNLREEVTMLKNRVRDLEAQNASLTSVVVSPAKGRDEGYCTMSSGQPQPSTGHLEGLPEEPEQMFVLNGGGAGSCVGVNGSGSSAGASCSGNGGVGVNGGIGNSDVNGVIGICCGIAGGCGEPCTADMEDWSMSQEELGAALDDDNNDNEWIWHSSSFLNSTVDSQSESISQLLKDTIIYSDDEEILCKDFTRDFYKLVNIKSGSTRSLQTPIGGDCNSSNSSSDESGHTDRLSPTPSEAGCAQVSTCSSSDSTSGSGGGGVGGSIETHNYSDNICNFSFPKESIQSTALPPLPPLPPIPSSSSIPLPSASAGTTFMKISNDYNRSTNNNNNSNRFRWTSNSNRQNQQERSDNLLQNVLNSSTNKNMATQSMPAPIWRRSTGWRRVSSQLIDTSAATKRNIAKNVPINQQHPATAPVTPNRSPVKRYPVMSPTSGLSYPSTSSTSSQLPPPIPNRRSYAS